MSKKDQQNVKEAVEAEAGTEAPDGAADAVEAGEAKAEQAPADPVAALTSERDDLLARLRRLSADYLNYQKRVQRDLASAREFANEDLIKDMLHVLDDMERALVAGRENHGTDDPFVAGMQLVHDKMIETLGRYGLTVIEAEGKPFDPAHHSAMMQQPSDTCPPQTVLAELVRGYQLKGRTIRPSGVIVACAPEGDQEEPPPETEED